MYRQNVVFHAIEYYLVIKSNEQLIHAKSWMNLKTLN